MTTYGPVRCNFCGNDDTSVLFKEGEAQVNQVVRCNVCGLMYANPRAKPPEYMQIEVEAYDPEWTGESAGTGRFKSLTFEKERLSVRDYADTKRFLRELHPQRGRLVEVGCSLGFLLDDFRQDGWTVYGVEPHRGCCLFLQNKRGISAFAGTLEEAQLESNSVDALVMLHVIEHVPDPLGTLREICRVLRPGGHLVLETPIYDTLMFSLFGRRERSISYDGHIYFFTSKSLRAMCEKAGFDVVKAQHVGRSMRLHRLLWNLGVMTKSPTIRSWLNTISARLHLEKVGLYLNLRDMQRVVVCKR